MISIIIPAFNVQDYLPDAIESCLDQNVHGEIIVVDDGSTDNTLAIAKKYEADRPDVIRVIHQVNKGLSSARNTGIMNAKYDWCLFLDADDMLADWGLEKIIYTIQENPDVDIVSGSLKTFGTSNQTIILQADPKLEDFRTGNRIGSSSAVRTSALKAVGGFSPRMVEGYEDLHLWCDLLSRGSKIKTIQDIVWLYRTKPESMWTDSLKYHDKLLAQINKDVPEAQLNF
jgi:glycosyltransferase involved in cell wall biosynthesis